MKKYKTQLLAITLSILFWILCFQCSAQTKNKEVDKIYQSVDLYHLQSNPILYKFIEEWHGTPYRLGGTNKRGIDCSQFNKRLYKDVYNKDLENTAQKQWNQTIRIPEAGLEVGDLVFFRSKISPSGWHTGVYIGNTFFVHAANKIEGVKVSSIEEARYRNSLRGYGRLK